jgi:hypothetical protein
MLLDAAVPTGYLNLPDFEEVLERYFAGNLDDDSSIDLTRLYLPLSQLIPGKPLLSQVDSQMMDTALAELPDLFAVAIAHRFQPDRTELGEWLTRKFVHQLDFQDYTEFLGNAYVRGVLALSDLIRRYL